jgi:Lar family restriction alleviation protein
MINILPCPFCGSTNITHFTNVTGDYGGHELECNDCGTNPCEQERTYEDAKRKWNSRAGHIVDVKMVRGYGMTPKGEPMPQTIEEWKHLVDLDEVAMHRMTKELGELKAKVARLTQQNDSLRGKQATNKVTRFEVIDHTWAGIGRVLAHYGCSVELSYQDEGKTLKVFLKDGE